MKRMTVVHDLFLNTCPSRYILEWYFENLPRRALSYSLSFDDEAYPQARHNFHDTDNGVLLVNGQYPYSAYAYLHPQRYLAARVLNIRIYSVHVDQKQNTALEHLRLVNSPRLLPMQKEYD
jgi:hypothetical protein